MNSNSLSLNEIAYNVLNALRGGRSSNNDYLSTDQIKFIIKYWRAVFIRRDQERNFNRYRMFEQELGDLSLIEESLVDGYYFYRTDEIPSPVRLKDTEAITNLSIGTEDVPFTDEHRAYWSSNNKYTANRKQAYYKNGYLYVKSKNEITGYLNVRGIFEDPEKVFDFVNEKAGNFEIYDANSPFPMPMDMIDQIMSGILNGTLKMLVTTPNDTTTDTLQGT